MKLKHTTIVSYTKRNVFYHIYAITITLLFCLLGIIKDEFGFSDVRTCSLEHSKSIRVVYNTFLLVNVALI